MICQLARRHRNAPGKRISRCASTDGGELSWCGSRTTSPEMDTRQVGIHLCESESGCFTELCRIGSGQRPSVYL